MDYMPQPKDTDWYMDTKTISIYMLPTRNALQIYEKQKKAEIAILITDKIDLKIKKVTRDKEGHYIMIKGSIQEKL